jgi:hypothetical protein
MRGKLNKELDIDKKIAECLNNKAEEISAPENMFFKVKAEILKENEGGFLNMKFGFLKLKTMVIVGILCIATTATCIAATNSSYWISSSCPINDIKQFPTADKVKKTAGYVPKYVESFEGGFKFDSMNVANASLKGDDGKTIVKTKDIYFDYTRDGKQKNQALFMTASAIDKKYFDQYRENKKEAAEYNGVKIFYSDIQRKVVPADYKKTEEESKLIEQGVLDMAFGSDEIEEYRSQSVSWYEDGIKYIIINEAYNDINKDAMLQMAKTVIDR